MADIAMSGRGTLRAEVARARDYAAVTRSVSRVAETRPTLAWYVAIAISGSLALVLVGTLAHATTTGIGVWGNNAPVFWGWPITNFVFWIGIGHAGTLISAILFLLRQHWRTPINRFAEAMTLFAVACAGIFPLFHMGRVWRSYWILPVPSEISMWPNFRSPLVWDVFAVTTYALVSALFWYVGLLPDLATWRDRATTPFRRRIFGLLSLGWRGSVPIGSGTTTKRTYLLLAGLATALVVSVHSIVSFDFAVSNVPGWHSTIFPPYFVAGAMFSGFAMVVTLLVVVRRVFDLQHLITLDVLEKMNRVILATSLIVGYAYGVELFIAWYSGNPYERFAFVNRAFGPYGWAYGTMVSCNVLVPQLFWWKRVRRSLPAMLGIAILVNVGMWFERFVIIVTALHRDYLPSSWSYFRPTLIDFLTFIGSVGLFFTLILLFVRVLPIVAMTEVKGAMKHESELEV